MSASPSPDMTARPSLLPKALAVRREPVDRREIPGLLVLKSGLQPEPPKETRKRRKPRQKKGGDA